MYDFNDYFDPEKRNRPYTVPGEELEDYLRLLDMILENYLEYKGMGSQQKLFSRGLVITESEMNSYFDMPPYFRERDICDPVLSAATAGAFSYIENRVETTKEIAANPSSPDYMNLLRIEYLKDIFELDKNEIIAILLSIAVGIDRRYERIYGFLQDNVQNGVPTIGLLYALVRRITPRDGAEEIKPFPLEKKMFTFFFIRKSEQSGLNDNLTLQPLMKQFIMGGQIREDNESSVFRLYREEKNIPVFFDDSYQEISSILSKEDLAKDPRQKERQFGEGNLLYIGNDDADTILHLLYLYSAEKRERLYVLDFRFLIAMKQEIRQAVLSDLFIRLKLFGGRLAISYEPMEDSALSQPDEQGFRVVDLFTQISHVCAPKYVCLFGQLEEPGELAAMFIPGLKVPRASVALRTVIWDHFLKSDEDLHLADNVNVPDLADCYEFPYGMIRKAVVHAVATQKIKGESCIDRAMILESLRQLNQVDFSGLATYVNPAYTWEDITITEPQKDVIKTACDRYRLRNRIGEGWGLKRKNAYGNGVSLLLYGPPGTGKTMAAQVIANELALPLYRVDISQISSKYIGETEKNLGIIFSAASKANVIIFFDEADALFSKRTNVSDSHDKYANNETAYLLQKIEEYDGMSILATNYYNNFDDAFIRRITYAVRMDSPDEATRYTLWTTILPKTAKIEEGIDFKFLADNFELSGSNIKAILFNAAYIAGAEGKAIGPEHIVRAMHLELTKLGKLVNSGGFGKYEKYIPYRDLEKDSKISYSSVREKEEEKSSPKATPKKRSPKGTPKAEKDSDD